MGENEDVLVNVDRGVGLITLNRPKAINSLTHPMVKAISPALADWAHDDAVHAVVLDGAANAASAQAATSSRSITAPRRRRCPRRASSGTTSTC